MTGRFLTVDEQNGLNIPDDVATWYGNSVKRSPQLVQKLEELSEWIRRVAQL